MRRHARLGLLGGVAMVFASVGSGGLRAGAEPHSQARRLTIDQAVELALKQSPRLRGTDAAIAAAEADRKKTRARFGPVLQVEGRAMVFDAPPALGGGATNEEGMAGLQALAGADPFDNAMVQLFAGLPSMFESESYDVNLAVRLVQPLTPLFAVYHGHRLAELGVDAARVAKERTKDELAFQVRDACLRMLQARAGLRALEDAVKTVEAHVARAEHFLAAGLIGRNDLLEAKARLESLRGDLLGVRHGSLLAGANLGMLLALPPGESVDILEPAIDPAGWPQPTLDDAQQKAAAQRPELQELKLRLRQADHGIQAAKNGHIPQLNAMVMFQHNEGSIMKPSAWTGGLVLNWNVWEWGATHYQVESVRAGRLRLLAAQEELQRGVDLQVRAAWLKISETRERIRIVASELAQAEEQLRIEQSLYEQQQSTSTDVLDAQSRVTAALVKRDNAQYEFLLAQAAMQKALGGMQPGDGRKEGSK